MVGRLGTRRLLDLVLLINGAAIAKLVIMTTISPSFLIVLSSHPGYVVPSSTRPCPRLPNAANKAASVFGSGSSTDHIRGGPPWNTRLDTCGTFLDPAALVRRSVKASKAIATFARYPERRPAGLTAAEDGSLDVPSMWQCWSKTTPSLPPRIIARHHAARLR